jgi:hypothetical protein
VIIIDIIVGSPCKAMFEAQVSFDLLMMAVTSGKERDEGEWRKIFMDAGCSHAPDLEGYSGQRTARCR